MATTKRYDVKDLALAGEGKRRIEWADRQMPVLAAKPGCERDLGDAEPEAPPQVGERAQLVQLPQPVVPVAGAAARGNDDAGTLQVAEHPRRPAGLLGRGGDVQLVHGPTLTHMCQGSLVPARP